MTLSYSDFLASKLHANDQHGFEPIWKCKEAFPFQNYLGDWSVRKGRAEIMADCGLGKSLLELFWGENIVRKTNKNVLLITPLAVGPQMEKEGEKFGMDCRVSRKGKIHKGITITNYERLHHFNPSDFIAVILDEAGILKNFAGKYRKEITAFLHKVKYRLLATATPAPNDFMELGTSSEALGCMSRGQMLGMFFTNGGETTQQWELKGHAKRRFWRWVCSWARACRKPSDFGEFSDKGYELPPLNTQLHKVGKRGYGFFSQAKTLDEQKAERRRTINERCEKVAELVAKRNDYCISWCHLNAEGDLLRKLIPDSVQVSGSDSLEEKEEKLTAFSEGKIKHLITKPKIGGFGLNLQFCNHMTEFPSHSFEAHYQCIRRCWRFGQKRPVQVDIVTSQGELLVLNNMQRKERQADQMFAGLVREMGEYQIEKKKIQESNGKVVIPSWL